MIKLEDKCYDQGHALGFLNTNAEFFKAEETCKNCGNLEPECLKSMII